MIEIIGLIMIIISIIAIYPYSKEKSFYKKKLPFDDKLSKLQKGNRS